VLTPAGLLRTVAAVGLVYNTPAENPRVSADERAYIAADQRTRKPRREARVDRGGLLRNRNLWIIGARYFSWGFMFCGFLHWLPQTFRPPTA
jgi:hypothetical protein